MLRKPFRRPAVLLLVAMLALLWVAPVSAADLNPAPVAGPETELVLGGSYYLGDGETLNEQLVIIGGSVTLGKGSIVNGDIMLMGGSLDMLGQVNGNVSAIGGSMDLMGGVSGNVGLMGGSMTLNSSAAIQGRLSQFGGSVTHKDGAVIENETLVWQESGQPVHQSNAGGKLSFLFDLFTKLLWKVMQSIATAAIAALVVTFLPRQTEQARLTLTRSPLQSGGVGLLTALVTPFALLVLILTLILIPVAVMLILVLAITALMGWILLGYEFGLRIEKAVKVDWQPAITAGVGTLAISLLSHAIGLIPCIGWVITTLFSLLGIGAVILSKFGSEAYLERKSVLTNEIVARATPTPTIVSGNDFRVEDLDNHAESDEEVIE